MSVLSDELSLAADFPAATSAQWRQLALGVLRRAGVASDDTPAEAVDELLSVTTYEGIRVAPLYTSGPPATPAPPTGVPGSPPYTRGTRTSAGWEVRQHHAEPDPEAAREAILADLDGGVTSVWLDLGDTGLDHRALPDVLDGLYPDLAAVVLDAGADTAPAARVFLSHAPAGTSGNLGADPYGWRARTGEPADPAGAVALAVRCAADFPSLRAVTVDATVYHDAGGSDAEELGCAVATGVAYLRALTDAGLDTATALGQLDFRYAATADQFLTIAKLRAARRVWARVADVCGAPAAGGQRQHAVTSSAMMAARDPWVNMIRTTLACFAAGVGGADAVTVQPFDARLGRPDGFARRIARNTQSLLLEEANVGRVVDPAGGSWYVERLTEEMAQHAWAWFTEIERAGGIAAALDRGLVADRLAATWARRADNIAHGRDPVIGVTEFPNLDERLPIREPARIPVPGAAAPTGGLPRHRYAEAFEALRDRVDAHGGPRPSVFLATLGPVAGHAVRAAFAANLFGAGGIAIVRPGDGAAGSTDATSGPDIDPAGPDIDPAGPDIDPAGIAAAFTASGATVACLCSADPVYAEMAAPVAAALRAAGARRIWLAGRPGDYGGVGDYLYPGCDAVAVLDTTLRDLAVA